MSHAIQSPFTLTDGSSLIVHDWPARRAGRVRGVVLIVHGLGEHGQRYDVLARQLNDWGFGVRAYDQRGHGRSDGKRGVLPCEDALLHDLAELLEDTRRHLAQPLACPLILLGHSMGGLVASSFVQRKRAPVDGLVLSSPALDAGIRPFMKQIIRVLCDWVPDLALSNGLDASKISHDPVVVRAYLQDPWVHDRITARLARFIDVNGPRVLAAAPGWCVPTLLMYAGSDHLVRPQGSRLFAAHAPADQVTSHCFADLYHEIFNEPEAGGVTAALQSWLGLQAPA